METVRDIYVQTRKFPKEELYGLAAQMSHSAVPAPSDIAEGQGRLTKGELKQFLGVGRGSWLELENSDLDSRGPSLC
jgi:four helix bundle protein